MTATLVPALEAARAPATPTAARPRWERPALALLLAATAVLYLWDLAGSGYANAFYSSAVQAGSQSWKAFLFGSSDAANSITVDKPPASLWPAEIAVRLFGLGPWAILVPQALAGVASVAVLHRTVRRSFGTTAGLVAGVVLALTPVAALMFRFNNPDALLVLLMVGAVGATLRAVEDGRTRWLVLTGVLLGLGFLTKQLQVFLVVGPLALTYLVAGPVGLRRRLVQLLAGLAALVVAAGWWIATVSLWPASSRPWIGGSQDNSIVELTLGYNGFGRLTGAETGSVGGGAGGGTPSWGATGLGRLLNAEFGGQISWLLPAALVLGVVGIALRGRAPRTDARRATLLVWGLWLVVTGLTFSLAQGIIHPYYTVALAPAIGALVGAGGASLCSHRDRWWAGPTLAVVLGATTGWAFVLLARTPMFLPWLRWTVLVLGLGVAVVLVGVSALPRRPLAVVVLAGLLVGLAGPTAYALRTVGTAHEGSLPTAGPTGGPGGGGRGGGGTGRTRGPVIGGTPSPLRGGPPSSSRGGLLSASVPSAALTRVLEQDAGSFTWVAATTGSNSASGYQLATQEPVMAIGGFNGSDPSPTLAQFQADVAAREIHYYVPGGSFGRAQDAEGTASGIAAWVAETFTSTTVDGTTLYDLTSPAA